MILTQKHTTVPFKSNHPSWDPTFISYIDEFDNSIKVDPFPS